MARKCTYCGNSGHNSRTCNHSANKNSHEISYSYLTSGASSSGLMSTIKDNNKGLAWSEEEHRIFLEGMEKLGKGNWRGISRCFVRTRTPTQVASHAQKYFLRQTRRRNTFRSRKHRLTLANEGTRNSDAVVLSHWLASATSTNCTSIQGAAAPDLELKLATPSPSL
ncbi:transcription factor MYBS3-like [Arachis stenosperma]|uniref:transcription factor MYBS3-like n=1 Tax=Arachis stenosperma TaxID=217475 RepID=UPI0025ACDBC7|nr:transcription factor MYBS3-like [Arachis stenosperma]